MLEQSLQDRYRLDERLATGGMGTVFAATDLRLNRKVAVKLLKPEFASDPRFVERFRREARSVASLSHPNIANVYDYGEENGSRFIVMELVEGVDLAMILRSEGPLSPERAASIAVEMCAALSHAHAAGVVHRDIKPANVLVAAGGRVKVTDFGIARAAGDSTLTATGSMLGTAHYLSPEQAVGSPITAASDIYSAGIVLFEMLTGAVPFTGDSAVAVAMQHVSEVVPAPSSVNPDVPAFMDAVVERATAKDPGARFSGAEAMMDSLRGGGLTAAPTRALSEPGPRTEPMDQTVWPIPGDRWDPRKVGRAVLITFALLGLIAAAALGWRLLDNDNQTNTPGTQGTQGEQQESERGDAPQEEPPANDAEPTPTEDPPSIVVPDGLIGQDFKDAQKSLKDAGFEVVTETVDSEEPNHVVVGVDPPAGTEVVSGETITLFVSKGGPPDGPPGQDEDDDEDDDD